MLDVPVATLRTWEDRYAQVVPARNDSGHRLFSRQQVEQLRFIRAQMGVGASAADAHRLLAERMQDGMPLTAPSPQPAIRMVILPCPWPPPPLRPSHSRPPGRLPTAHLFSSAVLPGPGRGE